MRVAGLVLAAGRATRFGATKQLAEVAGRPLVRIVADTARVAGLSPVVVVVGHDADAVAGALPDDVVVVTNEHFADGQSTSLRAGLAHLDGDADAVVVLLADEPGVAASVVGAVRDRLLAGAELVRCRYADRPGHPVGIASARWEQALATSRADTGARRLLEDESPVVVEVDSTGPVDVDVPSDLSAVRRPPDPGSAT